MDIWSSHAVLYVDRLRDEADGLQAGVRYLDKFEPFLLQDDHSSPETFQSPLYLSVSGTKGTLWDPLDLDLAYSSPDTGQAPQHNGSPGYLKAPTPRQGPARSSYLFESSNPDNSPTTDPLQSQLPIVPEYPHRELNSVDPKINGPTKTRRLPQATQWESLRELCLLSRLQYMEFLSLTSNSESRGIKKLRRLYGSARGMLDTGIRTFRDALDGQEPGSLKEVFAFTCLSFVVSKILQRHGRMEGCDVLADYIRWRLAIKHEEDRLTYDQVVKIIWPEIGSFATQPQAADGSSTSILLDSRPSLIALTDLSLGSDPADQHELHGLQDHVVELMQETSSHEAFMFAEFLDLDDLAWDSNRDNVYVMPPPDIMPTERPPDSSPRICQNIGPLETIDPRQLCTSYAQLENGSVGYLINPITNPKAQAQEPSSELFCSYSLPTFLEGLIDTVMFQTVVEFAKFVGSLSNMLYDLSGCGTIAYRNGLKIKNASRPIHELGEFINETSTLVFEPIKEALGEMNDFLDSVLYMAETLVRYGTLQTVREIEEYIITVSRYLGSGQNSFITLVTQTLWQCLRASDKMNWDYIYGSLSDDREEYSIEYIQKREAEEVVWALVNLKTEHQFEHLSGELTAATELGLPQHEGNLSSESVSSAMEKQKSSTASHSMMFPLSNLKDEPSSALCLCPMCNKPFKGKFARVNLRRHIRIVHERCKIIQCPMCGLPSTRRDNLRKHFKLKHRGEKIPEILTCKTRA